METFLTGARVVVSLAVVLGLLWMLQRRLTRGSRKSAAGRPVTIVTKQAISPKASVVIIDVEGTRLLLGVTEHAVSVLQTSDAPEPVIEVAPAIAAPSGAKAFAESLSKVTAARFTSQKAVAAKETAKDAATTKPTTKPAAAKPAARKPAATKPAPKNPEFAPVAAFTGQGPLAGSILSPATWKQLATTIRRGR
jgi:flagellar protein FliO/FliZ